MAGGEGVNVGRRHEQCGVPVGDDLGDARQVRANSARCEAIYSNSLIGEA